jgi:hypothetical protein
MKAFAAALSFALLALSSVEGLAAQAAAQDQPPPKPAFKSAVDLVAVDVSVIDRNGRPVPDLAAGDFTLTVDGKPRRIALGAVHRGGPRRRQRPARQADGVQFQHGSQGGRLVMIAVDSNMASAVHARRCHGARGG